MLEQSAYSSTLATLLLVLAGKDEVRTRMAIDRDAALMELPWTDRVAVVNSFALNRKLQVPSTHPNQLAGAQRATIICATWLDRLMISLASFGAR